MEPFHSPRESSQMPAINAATWIHLHHQQVACIIFVLIIDALGARNHGESCLFLGGCIVIVAPDLSSGMG